MRLKSFYGPTMTEAMRLVREALGENAIIVATRDDEMGGVRVTAAIEDQPAVPQKVAAPTKPEDQAGSEAIEVIATALLANHVSTSLAERILATATQFASEDSLLALGAAFDTHFKFSPLPDEPTDKPLMFIGPPGAGKTLCAAKIATKAVMAKKKVAIISTDTQRAGGMAQLAAFTRLLQTEMIEIEDSHALVDAIAIQPPGTFILIDTAGCNPFNEEDCQNLAALIKAAKADPILVMPADLDADDAIDMAKIFESLGATRLLPTRLDLTRRFGGLLRTAYESHLPLCHFSASSKVTESPNPMNPVSLARLLLPKKNEKTTATHRATGTN